MVIYFSGGGGGVGGWLSCEYYRRRFAGGHHMFVVLVFVFVVSIYVCVHVCMCDMCAPSIDKHDEKKKRDNEVQVPASG